MTLKAVSVLSPPLKEKDEKVKKCSSSRSGTLLKHFEGNYEVLHKEEGHCAYIAYTELNEQEMSCISRQRS
jgi:hypothetical protein